MSEPKRKFTRSSELWQQALQCVPGGTHTISKRVDRFADPETFPAFLCRGKGANVWDVDGNMYVDYIAALGPIVLGYGHQAVNEAITRELEKGCLFSLPSPIEVELAETLINIISCAEMVRFFKTGAEATSAAVRLCRKITGHEVILSCGYSGWHDWWKVKEDATGIPGCLKPLTCNFEFGNTESFLDALENHGNKIAAVIVTPALYGMNPPVGFLETIRKETSRRSVPLVYDEIITGFRWNIGGAQATYSVIPDLAAFGKAAANGMPLAFLAGRKDLMCELEDNWVTSTYAGDTLSIAAALAAIEVMRNEPVHKRLWEIAGTFQRCIEDIGSRNSVHLVQGDCLPALTFGFRPDDVSLARFEDVFIRQCADRGVLIRRDQMGFSLCLMAALTDNQLGDTIEIFERCLIASLDHCSNE